MSLYQRLLWIADLDLEPSAATIGALERRHQLPERNPRLGNADSTRQSPDQDAPVGVIDDVAGVNPDAAESGNVLLGAEAIPIRRPVRSEVLFR